MVLFFVFFCSVFFCSVFFCSVFFCSVFFCAYGPLQLIKGETHGRESATGPSAAEASSSNEEGTSSIFSDCPPVGKKKQQQRVENLSIIGPYLHIFLPGLKKAGLLIVNCAPST